MQPSAAVGLGQAVDPLGGGGEQNPVPGLAGPDRQPDGEVGLARARRAEKDDVVPSLHEVERAQMGDDVAAQAALVVEVEVLQRLAGREPGGPDADLAAVGLPCRHLPLEAGGEELLVAPSVGPGPFAETLDGAGQRGRLQRPAQIGEVGRRLGLGGGHHATSVMRS